MKGLEMGLLLLKKAISLKIAFHFLNCILNAIIYLLQQSLTEDVSSYIVLTCVIIQFSKLKFYNKENQRTKLQVS